MDKQAKPGDGLKELFQQSGPEKLGSFFSWWASQFSQAMARHNMSDVIMPLSGRYWGCKSHQHPGILCLRHSGTCLIERVMNCPDYNPDHDVPLFRAAGADLNNCLYCGEALSSVGDGKHISTQLCSDCMEEVIDSFQESFVRSMANISQEMRRINLTGGNE